MPAYTDSTTTQNTIGELRNVSQARRDRAFRGYRVSAPAAGTYAQGDIVLNSTPTAANNTLGWVCIAAGSPGTWVGWPGTVTQGDIQAASESRTVDMAGFNLTLDNVLTLDFNATLSVVCDAPATVIRNTDTGQAGLLQFREATINGDNYIGMRSTTSLATNYNITLPDALPTRAGQVFTVDSFGGGEARMEWTPIPQVVELEVVEYSTAVTTGPKKYFRISAGLDGKELTNVGLAVGSAKDTAGTLSVSIVRMRYPTVAAAARSTVNDMLLTAITIDANEWDSSDATTPAAIDPAADDVLEGDIIRVDVDNAGTSTSGLFLTLEFS